MARVKHYVVALVVCLVWLGLTAVGFADLKIVTETDGAPSETLYKSNRIAAPMGDGSNMILYCDVGEVAIVSSPDVQRYWRGTFGEIRTAFEQLFSEAMAGADDEDMPDLGALFGALFGGGDDEEILVRISPDGGDTVAGYRADRYVVETGRDGDWRVHEEVWISSDLLREVTGEVGACVEIMFDLQAELLGGVSIGMDELEAVLASSDYQALMQRGFPVRNKQTLRMFGMAVETLTEVVDVSRDKLGEDAFTVPSGYTRVSSPLELLGM